MGKLLLFSSAVLSIVWGCAHLIPTNKVVESFGDIGKDNQLIIAMGWIIEGIFLIFIGILVGIMTIADHTDPIATIVYFLSADVLVVLAVISLFTGFKVRQLPYKLCPVIFSISAVMIFLGVNI